MEITYCQNYMQELIFDKFSTLAYIFLSGIGILRLRHKLDREDQANLEVTIIAKDNVNPVQSSTATISVEVLDINDNNPVFDDYLSIYDIAENSDRDTSICRITATDRDTGEFGRIVYSFDIQNYDNALRINRTTVSISSDLFFIH